MTLSTLLFFFQAEDGIRHRNVTGVQTCALPISCRGSQNGPRREGFASPRNAGAPLTAAGRSERTPPSKRERGRVKSNQTTAVLAPFSAAIDTPPPCASPLEFQFSAVAVYQACGSVANPVWSKFPHALKRLGFRSHNFLAQPVSETSRAMYSPGSTIKSREALE